MVTCSFGTATASDPSSTSPPGATKTARPHTVLVTDELARAATSGTLRFTPLRPERVKGFDDLVHLVRVER